MRSFSVQNTLVDKLNGYGMTAKTPVPTVPAGGNMNASFDNGAGQIIKKIKIPKLNL